jgi:FAD:protein FMN transferase
MPRILTAMLAAILVVQSIGCQSEKRFEFQQPKMGTLFHIVLYAPSQQVADHAAAAAWARVDELNATLSDYDPNSELSRLSQRTNDGPMSQPMQVSDDLYRVLDRSLTASRLSDGAFDVTVGPFIRLWRRSRELRQLPTTQRIDEARQSIGYQNLKLDPKNHTVQLLAPRMRLDVGGIAKGYTAEESLKVIRLYGITRALVGAAGDIGTGDPPPGKPGWRIKLESLASDQSPPVYVLLKDHYAISTSGDTERFVIIDGVRYSHIVNPLSGLGLTDRIGVSVIAPNAITTDWASTAVSVLGPAKGLAMIEKIPDAAARITTLEDGRIKVWESSRFRRLVVQNEQ